MIIIWITVGLAWGWSGRLSAKVLWKKRFDEEPPVDLLIMSTILGPLGALFNYINYRACK